MLEKEVTEVCPHCEEEITMIWDTETMGFHAFCPVCGERLMLCDECRHTVCQDGEPHNCDYDKATDTCHRQKNRLPQKYRDICENLGWNVTVDSNGTVELEKYSPADEDFIFTVPVKDFVKAVEEYADDFDIDDHIAMWIEAKEHGTAGVPGARELVHDAEAIKEMLNELAEALAADGKSTIAESVASKADVLPTSSVEIRNIAYQMYQMWWCVNHGVTIADILAKYSEYWGEVEADSEDTGFADYLEETGFAGGQIWACMDEFLDCEYLDADIMAAILDQHNNPDLYKKYLQDRMDIQNENEED